MTLSGIRLLDSQKVNTLEYTINGIAQNEPNLAIIFRARDQIG
jgi:hypothetical protein